MGHIRKKFLLQNKWYITALEVFALLIAISALISYFNPTEELLHIAAVVPENLDKENTSQSVKAALMIYAERTNKYGGVNGKKLVIDFYDDHGEVKSAQKIAQKIVDEDNAVAVIGHFLDETTQAAGEIYRNKGIPSISPISNINPDQNWLFQLSPTRESYGVYIANYIKRALKQDQVSIVRSDNEYDNQLIEAFIAHFSDLGGIVNQIFTIDHTVDNTDHIDIENITDEIKEDIEENDETDFLLIAIPEAQSIPLITQIKRQHLDIKMMITQGSLLNKFKNTRPRYYKGYYSEGIYTPEIIIPDSVNKTFLALVRKDYEIRHNHKISSTAMTATLAAVTLVNILKRKEFKKFNDNQSARNQLKKILQYFGWYNKDQVGIGSVLLFGVYSKNDLITAPINPISIEYGDISPLNKKNNAEKLFSINNENLYMTDFVYAGVSMKKIEKIDFDTLNYNMSFYLWFRYKEDIKGADNIEFINSIEVIRLFDLLEKKKGKHGRPPPRPKKDIKKTDSLRESFSAKLVESQTVDGEVYHRYHIRGRFKTGNQKNYTVGQQNLYVRFRNSEYNTYQLRYVIDFNNANNGVFHPERNRTNYSLLDNKHIKLNYSFDHIGTSQKTTLGSPKDLKQSTRYSEFIAEYRIESNLWSFRGIAAWINKKISGRDDQIDTDLMIFLLVLSYIVFQFTRYIQKRNAINGISNYLWLLQLFSIFLFLLFGEFALSQTIFDLKYSHWGELNRTEINVLMLYTGYIIAILWWIIPAHYISSAVDQFLWKPIQHRTQAKIPAVLRLFIITIIYMLAILGIMAFVFKVTVAGLAATSGMIALLFAFASKVDLSNIIAGLGISFSRIFKLGDWVNINDSIDGKIIELTPRSTNILTADASIISVPNTVVSNAIIKNYNRPNNNFCLDISLEVMINDDKEMIEKTLLQAVLNVEGVLTTPTAIIRCNGQDKDSIQTYDILFYIDNYGQRHSITENVWRSIAKVLKSSRICLDNNFLLEQNKNS